MLAMLLIGSCITYTVLAITAPDAAEGTGGAFIGIVTVGSALLRILRRT